MSYYAKKICDGLSLSAVVKDTVAERLAVSYIAKHDVADDIHKCVENAIMKFLKKYEKHTAILCNNRGYYLKGEVEDCKQFVMMNLCKSYPKRYRYTNFDKVVRSIIKRKVIDFSKMRNNDVKFIVNESSFNKKDESFSLEKIVDEKSPSEYCNDTCDVRKIVSRVMEAAQSCEHMNKNDLKIVETIKGCVSRGVYDLDEILRHISENKYKATYEFGLFVGRLNKHVDMGGFR